jgi:hypothetical protein
MGSREDVEDEDEDAEIALSFATDFRDTMEDC